MSSPSVRTAEEAKADYIARMGDELGEIYSALWHELAWVHSKRAEYMTLFGTSPERIELLNKAAPKFFRTVQDSLWEDVLLHLARLTDPPQTAGKENLSVKRLPNLSAFQAEPKRTELAELIDTSCKTTEFARDWRNRRLAHRDLGLALGNQVESLAPASLQAVQHALVALDGVMNWIGKRFLGTPTTFETSDSDVEVLLSVIRDGLQFGTERRQRIATGNVRPDDLNPEPL